MSLTSLRRSPRRTLGDGWRLFLYLAWGIGTSIVAMLTIALVLLVAVLSLLGVGLLLVPSLMRAVHGVAYWELQRLRTAGYHVDDPFGSLVTTHTEISWTAAIEVLTDPSTGRTIAWLLWHATLGLLAGLIGVILPATAISEIALPAYWWAVPAGEATSALAIPVPSWQVAVLFAALAPVWIVAFGYLGPYLLRLQSWHSRTLLKPATRVDLSRRISELTATRAAALNAHTSELRRIERALHDGSQNRLVAVAVLTGAARRAVERDPQSAGEAMEAAHQASEEALAELRSVVRSILPPVLIDRGLQGALLGLTTHSVVPCRTAIADLPRIATSVEACAYFAVAELLSNVAKHSAATSVGVSAEVEGNRLWLQVWDNGTGGADGDAGTGLTGIGDRVAALDGSLRLSSPEGGPTVVEVELPCG